MRVEGTGEQRHLEAGSGESTPNPQWTGEDPQDSERGRELGKGGRS